MAKRAVSTTTRPRVDSIKTDAMASLTCTGRPNGKPTEDDIRVRAYHRYLERGATPGNDLDDWVEAEKDLRVDVSHNWRVPAPAIARPMLASLVDAPLDDPGFVYEPKYDGIRAIVEIAARGKQVTLWSRLGNDKTRQFPEIAGALREVGEAAERAVVLDGEIVALDATGDPAGFQQLQGRIHLTSADAARRRRTRAAFIAFDRAARRQRRFSRSAARSSAAEALEDIFGDTGSPILRLSEIAHGDGRALHERALANGWEGLIAKLATSRYISGKRTPDWRKLKIVQEQEFVVGGWTEPRNSRLHFGALILGVYEGGTLRYAGHVGTGLRRTRNSSAAVRAAQAARRRKTSPSRAVPPRTRSRTG